LRETSRLTKINHEKKYNLRDAVAVVTGAAGALWPYRLITGIFRRLLDQYPTRLTIDTSTPVTAISFESACETQFAYTVTTPRGQIRARTVIHCTNGHAGHLLPRLRGKIFPLRGTMSAQKAGPDFPDHEGKRSWNVHHKPTVDLKTGAYTTGLLYIAQNAKTGDIWIGGEKQIPEEMLVSDDSIVPDIPKENLVTILPKVFKTGWDNATPEPRLVWSGIMGFTADSLPLIGPLTEKMTGRAGNGEWIAAGFNGYGMDKCWLSGEGLVGLIAGQAATGILPSAYLISDERIEKVMNGNWLIDVLSNTSVQSNLRT
jgi:glycine/D-amino acid oxidase-like deaminating enzyme